MLQLNDEKLLRQQCYIDGAWCDADSGESFAVTNPATAAAIAHVPNMGGNRSPPCDCGGQPRVRRLAPQDSQGTQRHFA